MKSILPFTFFIAFFSITSFHLFGQEFAYNQKIIKIYDKNTGEEITSLASYEILNDTIFINYSKRNIILNCSKGKLKYKFIYIFIDTVNNPTDCFIYMETNNHQSAIHYCVNSCNCYGKANVHVVRSIDYEDKKPEHAFHRSDFFELPIDGWGIFAGSGYSFGGLKFGGGIKYGMDSGYTYVAYQMQYTRILNGNQNGLNEISAGFNFLPIPVGFHLSYLFQENLDLINVRPQIGFDSGVLSFSYGYAIPLYGNMEIESKLRHQFTVELGINLSEPIKNKRTKFPYDDFKL